MKTGTAGFSLVEVTLALGVAGFCLLAILGLLPVGLKSDRDSIEQTAAASLVRAIASDLETTPRIDPPGSQTSPVFGIPVPSSGTESHTLFFGEDGTVSGAVDANAIPGDSPRYRASMDFTAPATTTGATQVRILVTWPALADPTASQPPTNYASSFEVSTALDRN